MTDQRRAVPDRGGEQQAPGYRGALPPRTDSLARPWVIVVFAIFVLIFALSLANVPTTLFPSSSASPVPSVTAAPSGSATASGSPNPSASASASAAASASVSPIPSGSATP